MQRLSKFQIDLLIDNCKIIKKELKKEADKKKLLKSTFNTIIESQDKCIDTLIKMRGV
jgi:hypothetical protein